jgi:hypothetical protein
MSLASSFDRRGESAEMTEAAADALIRDHADRAYWVARRKSSEADSEAKSQFWGRVAMRIFLKSAKRYG